MSAPIIPDDLLQHATPQEIIAYERALTLELALASPLDYATYTTPASERYPHIELLNEYLMALFEGRLYHDGPGPLPEGFGDDARHPMNGDPPVDYLAISMPPRHGKSYLVSEHLPAWFLTKFPDYGFILASYESDFAADWGRKARNILEAHPEFGVEVDQTSRAADRWNISGHRGRMKTAGAGGPITGEGGQTILIDDPIKNNEDAQSKTLRDKQKDWMLSTVDTRREPYPPTGRLAPVIIMATRWHEDDLIGWSTKTQPKKWCVLNLPALALGPDEADEPDPLGRAPGEPLCPSRFTKKQLIDKRENGDEDGQGLAWFNALYQGRPSTDGSGIFKRQNFLYYTARKVSDTHRIYTLMHRDGTTSEVDSRHCFRFQTADLAASTKTSADWTVIATWDVTPNRDLILVDRLRERMDSADHTDSAVAQFNLHKPKFIGVEKQTYGLTLITNLLRSGKPVRALDADKDKVSRAIPAGYAIDNGKVFFPKAAWISEWEEELTQFDNGRHDDQVDVLSYAVLQLSNMPPPRRAKEQEFNTVEERISKKFDKRRKRRHHPQLGRL